MMDPTIPGEYSADQSQRNLPGDAPTCSADWPAPIVVPRMRGAPHCFTSVAEVQPGLEEVEAGNT